MPSEYENVIHIGVVVVRALKTESYVPIRTLTS